MNLYEALFVLYMVHMSLYGIYKFRQIMAPLVLKSTHIYFIGDFWDIYKVHKNLVHFLYVKAVYTPVILFDYVKN